MPAQDATLQSMGAVTARKKIFHSKTRTGCLTCRARRVKCDEARPVCRRCITANRECRGYFSTLPNEDTIAQAWISRVQGICPEAEPPNWDFTQAVHYHFAVLKPAMLHQDDPEFYRKGFIPCRFICQMMADQISKASKARGRLIGPGEDPAFAGLWSKFHHYMAECLQIINQTIRGEGEYQQVQIILGILYLVFMDLYQKASMWHAHIKGFLAYFEHLGGAAVGVDDPDMRNFMSIMLLLATPLNTTTPARDQITGFDTFTDAQLDRFFGPAAKPDMPCPSDFFIGIIHVTRMRGVVRRAETGLAAEQDVRSSLNTIPAKVLEIFDTTCRFDIKEWATELLINDQDLWSPEHSPNSGAALLPVMGEIYGVAVRLYGILTLPEWAIEPWASSASDKYPQVLGLTSHESLRALHRLELLALLRQICGGIAHDEGLAWPLAVAGVAVAEGSADDRAFVERCLWNTWRLPNTVASFVLLIDKLRAFWSSGKTAWEDCFDEPTQCTP
ncbi:hypothetical protein PWT90_07868 [Aphanocladium album]|nr:hypothetical protein PWT90_07868 [Aphanocladium album]